MTREDREARTYAACAAAGLLVPDAAMILAILRHPGDTPLPVVMIFVTFSYAVLCPPLSVIAGKVRGG